MFIEAKFLIEIADQERQRMSSEGNGGSRTSHTLSKEERVLGRLRVRGTYYLGGRMCVALRGGP